MRDVGKKLIVRHRVGGEDGKEEHVAHQGRARQGPRDGQVQEVAQPHRARHQVGGYQGADGVPRRDHGRLGGEAERHHRRGIRGALPRGARAQVQEPARMEPGGIRDQADSRGLRRVPPAGARHPHPEERPLQDAQGGRDREQAAPRPSEALADHESGGRRRARRQEPLLPHIHPAAEAQGAA